MKKRLLLATIMFLSAGTFAMGATTGKIAGVVRDASTGVPLPATNVILEGTTLGAAADNDGNYFIINVPPGDYTIRANIIGYTVLAVTDVRVSIDRTTTIDFTLEQATVAGEEVVVVAERPRIQKDVSFTQVTMSGDEVRAIPMTPDLREALAVSAGVTRDPMGFIRIRGGNYDEVGLYVDGFNSNDSRQGNPELKVAKAEIQEIQILKGGFNAEYGKARAGIVNIITKGGGDKYSFSIENRFSPAARKHFGPAIYSSENYWFAGRFLTLGPSEDRNGDGEPDFVGWTQWLADKGGSITYSLPGMGDQTITSPEQALAIWKHMHPQWEYGNKPDYNVEATLSGPVPFTKGKTTFIASAFYDKAYYFIPFVTDHHLETRANLRVTHKLSTNITLRAHGAFSDFQSSAHGCPRSTEGYSARTEFVDPRTFVSAHVLGQGKIQASATRDLPYTIGSITTPANVTQYTAGLGLTHVLNPASFYEVKFQFSYTTSLSEPGRFTDIETVVATIDGFKLNEIPHGFYGVPTSDFTGFYRMGEDNGRRDNSNYTNIGVDVDYTNQVNHFNLIKVGAGIFMSNQDLFYGIDLLRFNDDLRYLRWINNEHNFIEAEAYVQDKIEFLGMVMNVGLRLDYFSTDALAFTEPYSEYYTVELNYSNPILAETPNEEGGIGIPGGEGEGIYGAPSKKPDAKIALSPRLGISHPIGDNSKFFFNYGYFYQRPDVFDLSNNYQRRRNRATSISNADLDFRKTVAYEAGVEQNIAGIFNVSLSGYYRDVTQDVRGVSYNGDYEGSRIGYGRPENTGYADRRGFELSVDFRFGRYVRGFLNYDYALASAGRYGYSSIYQDPMRANVEVSASISEAKARPNFRANLFLHYPTGGTSIVDLILSGASLSTYFTWRAGQWLTYHSDNYPGFESNNVQWKATHNLDLELSKPISLPGGFHVEAYLQVRNVLNSKFLDPDPASSFYGSGLNPISRNEYLDRIAEQGLEPGDYEGNEIVEKTLERGRYWLMNNLPRDVWFGLRFNFN